jgi:hypothetical protein
MVYQPFVREMDSPTRNVRTSESHHLDMFAYYLHVPAMLNIIETLLNIIYLYLAHVVQWPPATIIGFVSAAMTLAKTVLYWLQEYYCGYCAVGHNTFWRLMFFWIIPNGCVILRFVFAHLICC